MDRTSGSRTIFQAGHSLLLLKLPCYLHEVTYGLLFGTIWGLVLSVENLMPACRNPAKLHRKYANINPHIMSDWLIDYKLHYLYMSSVTIQNKTSHNTSFCTKTHFQIVMKLSTLKSYTIQKNIPFSQLKYYMMILTYPKIVYLYYSTFSFCKCIFLMFIPFYHMV